MTGEALEARIESRPFSRQGDGTTTKLANALYEFSSFTKVKGKGNEHENENENENGTKTKKRTRCQVFHIQAKQKQSLVRQEKKKLRPRPKRFLLTRMGDSEQPTLMYAMRARFFTRPTACPSGVSAGQMNPQCVLCSCRGLACASSRVESSRPRSRHETKKSRTSKHGRKSLSKPCRAAPTFLWTSYVELVRNHF